MKKFFKAILALSLVSGVFSSCSDTLLTEGEGTVSFDVKLVGEPTVLTRASNETALAENCIVYVYSSKGLIRKYRGTNTIPSQLYLNSGNYRVTAAAGDSVAASFTDRYFYGESPFAVSAGGNTAVSVNCKIKNTVVAVDFGNVAEVLSDYTVDVANGGGSLEYNKDNAGTKGYFMMDSGETELEWTLTGTQLNGQEYTQKGTIANVKPSTQYTLKMTYVAQTNGDFGGALFEIDVEEEEIVSQTVTITAAPKFMLSGGLNLTDAVVKEPASFESNIGVYCSSACALKSLVVSGADNVLTTLGLPANEFDLFAVDDAYRTNLETLGVGFTYDYNSAEDNAIANVTLAKEMLNKLSDGIYKITFTATDEKGKVRNYVMTIEITAASVSTVTIVEEDVYATRATISGSILKENSTGSGLRYRAQGASEWIDAQAVINGTSMSANLSGLSAGTTYEFQAYCDGFAGNIKTFTTEAAAQLPNSGFESWTTNSSPYLVYAQGEDMFWDTGNHGSATMNKNVTVPSTAYVHSGTYSIDLKSQFVGIFGIGKFAAGNVFAGKYIRTDGTDGVLGWGRPFFSRPSQLKGYVRYAPKEINNNAGAVEGATGMDKGQIFIALWDNYTETDSNSGETWPKIIKTKSSERQVFDVNSEHIIGYGQITFAEATAGDGLVEFTVDIEYRNKKKPSAIILTCTSSIYGDYFCGGDSEMWIDDLQLVY